MNIVELNHRQGGGGWRCQALLFLEPLPTALAHDRRQDLALHALDYRVDG